MNRLKKLIKDIKYFWLRQTKLHRIFFNAISCFSLNKEKRNTFRIKLITNKKKEYLKKYLYCLDNAKKNKINNNVFNKDIKINKTIWVCWFQGEENAPEIIKICIKSLKKYKPKDYNIQIITDKNINNFIQIPQYIINKRNKNIINLAHFADILRVLLLNEYGGVWIDATTYLMDNIPDNILNTDFFAFHTEGTGNHLIENWFLVSKKGNFFVATISNFLLEYWKNEKNAIDYFFFHLFSDMVIENNLEINQLWQNTPYYCDKYCYELMSVLFSEFNMEIYQNILKKSSIQKLSWKYDKNTNIKNTFFEYIKNK